jgi:CYTH domain-containing protein
MADPKTLGPKTKAEIERRYVVLDYDNERFEQLVPALFDQLSQGYHSLPPSPEKRELRIRLINGTKAIVTYKQGTGERREETEAEIPWKIGLALYEASQARIKKLRKKIDDWEFDIYQGPLLGLLIAEYEKADPAEAFPPLPSWITRAVDVTDFISNSKLAQFAAVYDPSTPRDCSMGEYVIRHFGEPF